MTSVFFFYFAGVIVLMAVLVIALRKPIYGALALLVLFFHVAGLYVLLEAEFIAVIQIIVYAGAILVLYLFVVMLLNVRPDEGYHRQLGIGLAVAGALVIEVLFIVSRAVFSDRPSVSALPTLAATDGTAPPAGLGNTESVGHALYTTYLLPFEVASLILLVAMVGAILISKKGIFDS